MELGIDPRQAEKLFYIIDVDDRGEIHIDVFVEGCMRLMRDVKHIGACSPPFDSSWV